MTTSELSSAIRRLGAEERIRLIGEIWDSLCETPEDIPTPDWQREELDRRRAEYLENPESYMSWEEAREWLRRRHG